MMSPSRSFAVPFKADSRLAAAALKWNPTGRDPPECSTLACSMPVTLRVSSQYTDSCSGTVLQAFAKEVECLEPEGMDILVNNAGQGEYTLRAIET